MLRVALGLLLLMPFAAAQAGEPLQRVTVINWHRPEANLQVDTEEGRIRKVTWQVPGKAGEPVMLLLTRPVRDLEAGLLPGGNTLVLLAGGVRDAESLELIIADRSGRFYSFASTGGSRLGSEFADGLGSWPLVDGTDLLMFAYRRQGRIEFRAYDLSWSDPKAEGANLLVSQKLPATGGQGEAVRGFQAVSDLDSNEVHVTFDGGGAPIDIWHPLAPRPKLYQALLDFGDVAPGKVVERTCVVGNTGKRPLLLDIATHEPFVLVGAARQRVAPGSQVSIRVRFEPVAPGSLPARLELRTNSSSRTLAVRLRGECVDPAVAVVVPPPAATAPVTDETLAPPAPVRLASAPSILACSSVRIASAGPGRVRVTGIANIAGPGIELALRGAVAEARTVADAAGAFAVEVDAGPGEQLVATAVGEDGTTSLPVLLGRVLPWLRLEGQVLELRGPASWRFTLLSVALAADGQGVERCLASWSGQLGEGGLRQITLGQLGLPKPAVLMAVVQDGPGLASSNLLRLH